MKLTPIVYSIFFIFQYGGFAQHHFSGYVDKTNWTEDVYLSLVEDYRKISGIYPEQIIQKATPDSTGYFTFSGDQLPSDNHIYRIHVDNCSKTHENKSHLNGFCTNSKELLFIANNRDTLSFPFSFDKEMFCKIISNNEKNTAFIKIDSIIDEMRFAFGNYRSKANRKINSHRWINTLQHFGKNLNEPLIELYVYAFLSNKTNDLYDHYLDDLSTSNYYNQLLERLQEKYPNSPYTKRYEIELASDKFLLDPEAAQKKSWLWILLMVLLVSVLLNILQFVIYKRRRKPTWVSETKLTQQEQKILALILEDKTNKEIASSMFVSVSTVKTHINNLYKKLGTTSRSEVKSLHIK